MQSEINFDFYSVSLIKASVYWLKVYGFSCPEMLEADVHMYAPFCLFNPAATPSSSSLDAYLCEWWSPCHGQAFSHLPYTGRAGGCTEYGFSHWACSQSCLWLAGWARTGHCKSKSSWLGWGWRQREVRRERTYCLCWFWVALCAFCILFERFSSTLDPLMPCVWGGGGQVFTLCWGTRLGLKWLLKCCSVSRSLCTLF